MKTRNERKETERIRKDKKAVAVLLIRVEVQIRTREYGVDELGHGQKQVTYPVELRLKPKVDSHASYQERRLMLNSLKLFGAKVSDGEM